MPVDATAAVAEVSAAPGGVSVALVVDQELLAGQLRNILAENDLCCLTQVESIEKLAAQAAPEEIDAIVLRKGAARSQVLDVFKTARARFPDTPIVGLWPNDQRRDDQRALKAGIDGLLPESQIEAALGPTVRAVCTGLVCFPRRIQVDGDRYSLSSREKQVLGMLIMGFTNAEIGRRLYLAESTVKSHLSSAYMKLGVRSRKDAAALILDPEQGLGTGLLAISGD